MSCSQHKQKVNDDYPTPKFVWEDIEKYIPKDKKIWCPFYCDGIHTLEELGYDIIHENKDFFTYEPDEYDIIVDNPPFSIKKKIIPRMIALDKPFILIMPCSTLCYQYFEPLAEKIQLIIPPKRYNFKKELKSSASFDCLFFCYKMGLEKDIIKIPSVI